LSKALLKRRNKQGFKLGESLVNHKLRILTPVYTVLLIQTTWCTSKQQHGRKMKSKTNYANQNQHCIMADFFFLINVGCPGQLVRTTTIPHGPLDTLQAQEQVRHRGGDRRAHRGFEPGTGTEQVTRLTTAARPSSAF